MPIIPRRQLLPVILLLACAPGVAQAQVGRIYVSLEAYVGMARVVHVGKIVELEPIKYDKPLNKIQKFGKPYRLVFKAVETIKPVQIDDEAAAPARPGPARPAQGEF